MIAPARGPAVSPVPSDPRAVPSAGVFRDTGGACRAAGPRRFRYAGPKLRAVLKGHGGWTIDIIKRSDTAKGFEVLPRRWVVERTFAWLERCRRLAKDWETSIESSTAWTFIASVKMMTRRLATYCYPS